MKEMGKFTERKHSKLVGKKCQINEKINSQFIVLKWQTYQKKNSKFTRNNGTIMKNNGQTYQKNCQIYKAIIC